MDEGEIIRELTALLAGAGLSSDVVEPIVERIMGMVQEYAGERSSEAALDAIRDYDERM